MLQANRRTMDGANGYHIVVRFIKRSNHWLILLTATLLSTCRPGASYSFGAPHTSCVNGFPGHGESPMLTTPPYEIELNQSTYLPSDVIRVVLRATEGATFRGFQLRAQRVSGDTEELVGEFVNVEDCSAIARYWYPDRDQPNCVTHSEASDKTEVVLYWKAPPEAVGDVVFRCGIAETYERFWVDVKSPLLFSVDIAEETYVAPKLQPFELNLQKCDTNETGCFLYPSDCRLSECFYIVTYESIAGAKAIRFQILGKAEGYVSIGFSKDEAMGEDSTITCVADDDFIEIQHGYNEGLINVRHRRNELRDVRIRKKDGYILCEFVRPLNLSILQEEHIPGEQPSWTIFDLTEKWYLFIGWGELEEGTSVLRKHEQLPIKSKHQIDFSKFGRVYGKSISLEVQLHGTFALLAWMVFAGIAMIIARHFKREMSDTCLGVGLWFQLHRAVVVLIVICTAIAMIIMFSHLGKWTQNAVVHAIFGLIASGLTVVQIVVAYFRPGFSSDRRPLFNWFHRIVGISAYVCAAIAVVLGVNVSIWMPTLRARETYIILPWIALQLCWETGFEILRFISNRSVLVKRPGPDGSMAVEEVREPQGKTTTPRKIFLFILYCISNIPFLIISLSFLYLA